MTTETSDYENFERLSVEHRRLLRQEELILEVTEAIARALKEVQITQSELAERLGKTKGFVSQILGGGRNLTLRTLSDVSDALGCTVHVEIFPEPEEIEGMLDWPHQCHSHETSWSIYHANENDGWSKAA